MELQKITELIELMSRSDLTELQFQEAGHSLRLLRGTATTKAVEVGPRGANHDSEGMSTEIAPAEARAGESPPQAPVPLTFSGRQVFKSPMVGTFFRAGAPGDKPFIDVGQEVKPGQTLGVIEAMKMLTALECDVEGRIAEVLVENGAFVEFGQPLFSIE
jgi:acetyl-CoA carboxylase biotin carboxyl carrier protein